MVTGSTEPAAIVGIGASAGGIEALQKFLAAIPTDTGLAWVVLQHLAPNHGTGMPGLLQRTTSLPLAAATDGLLLQADHVYLRPAGQNLTVGAGRLLLSPTVHADDPQSAIDLFLVSLAKSFGDRAIGVLLSGMGRDGCAGLAAIQRAGGMTLVQEPSDAAFPAMPEAAIEAHVVDLRAAAGDLPAALLSAVRRLPAEHPASAELAQLEADLQRILDLLLRHTGEDFTQYKIATLKRRIERRMDVHHLSRMGDYANFLRDNPQEVDILFKECLIGVTSFFRDPIVWLAVRDIAFPALFSDHPAGRALRAWVPACSTGEEAYTLAMVFHEALDMHRPAGQWSLQIFATDISVDAIEFARHGRYPERVVNALGEARLARYFYRAATGYQINGQIREMVVFAPHNMIQDPPFTSLDLLSCRNTMIYFSPQLQSDMMALFHYSLNPGGMLLLGPAEWTGTGEPAMFEALEQSSRLFRRLETSTYSRDIKFPTRTPPKTGAGSKQTTMEHSPNLQDAAGELLLREIAPAAVLVTADGDIVYINGRTGPYLEPAAGKANWNIHAMAREGMRVALGRLLRKVSEDHSRSVSPNVLIDDGTTVHNINLVAQWIDQPEALKGLILLVFEHAVPGPRLDRKEGSDSSAREIELEAELQQAQEEIRDLRKQAQTSLEQVKVINEELQSTNEELTSSKEEMQSLNEELQTVNTELRSRLEDLSRVNDDMQNLLNSTELATIFLDENLNIRRFTPATVSIIKLIDADVGRPLSDLANDLDYPDIGSDIDEVLRSLVYCEKPVSTRDGRWFKTRIMPYRTTENLISGVVITFTDITEAKNLEVKLRAVIEQQPASPGHA
ncbi:MAG: chemotaxis protein CheB [Halieaceae bacterium]|jgi:chemotaxis methyl-accepting protein methylase|nr:chemotaxis protein CheB [Halieaceae bacterium]